MKSIKLLHVGDVHYPDVVNVGPKIDVKDKGFGPSFLETLAPHPFLVVGRSLAQHLEREDIDGVLFSGDLTSSSNLQAYADCARYFHDLIEIADSRREKKLFVEVVPGNHDLKRKGISTSALEERFGDFRLVWKGLGRDVFPVDAIKVSCLKKGAVILKVLSLNTCLGCGEEYKKFPDDMANVYRTLLDGADLDDREQFDRFCERLDTPAIHQDHMSSIEDEITDGTENSLCLILGHHALLPQPTPRIALYTEIINAGNVRMSLATLESPIIYCHGHIHDDPIEIVSHPRMSNSNLVLLSAPMYVSGFNVIEIIYTDSGNALGIVVQPHRVTSFGGIRPSSVVKIPLRQPKELIRFCDARTEAVYRSIDGKDMRCQELQSKLEGAGMDLQQGELENMLTELEWLRVVSISNSHSSSRSWVITRVGL